VPSHADLYFASQRAALEASARSPVPTPPPGSRRDPPPLVFRPNRRAGHRSPRH
jgi:hypothetical protein